MIWYKNLYLVFIFTAVYLVLAQKLFAQFSLCMLTDLSSLRYQSDPRVRNHLLVETRGSQYYRLNFSRYDTFNLYTWMNNYTKNTEIQEINLPKLYNFSSLYSETSTISYFTMSNLSHPWTRSLTGRDVIEYITGDVMTFSNLQLSYF